MSSRSNGFIGIDFGTTNTYISRISPGFHSHQSEELAQGMQKGVPTAVLYRPRSEETIAYGRDAMEEWVNMETRQKKDFQFATNFKPEIAQSVEAQTQTRLFLQALREEMRASGWFGKPDLEYVVGLPAKRKDVLGPIYKQLLGEVAFLPFSLMDEPLGALFSHIYARDISQEQALRGVLVVDFGGGTLDLAWIKDFQVQKVWGNPLIGGRIFDDLLYRWFLDQSKPEIQDRITKDQNEAYLRNILFPSIKERYSRWMNRSATHPFRDRISVGDQDYGSFIGPTKDEFLQTLIAYVPTENFQNTWKGWERLQNSNGSVDIPQTIRNAIFPHSEDFRSLRQEISLVILTGGSSRWPFFRELIAQEDLFPLTPTLWSASPESSISQGLGLAIASRAQGIRVRDEWDEEEPELINRVIPRMRSIYRQALWSYFQKIQTHLHPQLVQEWEQYYKTGGKVSDLQKRWEERYRKTIEHENEALFDHLQSQIRSECTVMLEEETKRWFDALAVPIRSLPSIQTLKIGSVMSIDGKIAQSMYTLISSLISVLVGGMGVLAASSGIGFLSGGPLGLAGGFLSGVILSLLVSFGLKKNISSKLNEISFRPYLLKILFFPKSVVMKKLQKALEKEFLIAHEQAMKGFDEELGLIKKEIHRVLVQTLKEVYCSIIFDYLEFIGGES